MREHVVIIQELEHSSTRSSMQVTVGQPFKQMLRLMSRCATNVSDSVMSLDNSRSTLPQ